MKLATLNKGKETKYLNHYPLIDEEDLFEHDHLKEGDLITLGDRATTIYSYWIYWKTT